MCVLFYPRKKQVQPLKKNFYQCKYKVLIITGSFPKFLILSYATCENFLKYRVNPQWITKLYLVIWSLFILQVCSCLFCLTIAYIWFWNGPCFLTFYCPFTALISIFDWIQWIFSFLEKEKVRYFELMTIVLTVLLKRHF